MSGFIRTRQTQDLLPKVPTGAVMDNATFHQRQDTPDTMTNAGFILEYLPAYSPDLNPIEHDWAKAKKQRRKLQCDIDTLLRSHL